MSEQMQPMAPVDTAWWHMESEDNPMMITGVLVLDRPVDVEDFRRIIEQRLLAFERFSKRVVEHDGRAYWQQDPLFDLDNHIHHVSLPDPQDKQALETFAADLASTPLDFHHPPWQFHLVDHYLDGGAAIVSRLHHCIADGLALVQVLLSLTDQGQDKGRHSGQEAQGGPLHAFTDAVRTFAQKGAHLGHSLMEEGMELVRHPQHIREWVDDGRDMVQQLEQLGLGPKDPDTRFHSPLSGRKVVSWAEPLALARVKELAHGLEGTVNDVLMASVTGALRRYLGEVDRQIKGNIHVTIPFNLRPQGTPVQSLGNQFGLVLVELPLEETDPLERFRRVRQAMIECKHSTQPRVTFGLLELLGHGPAALEKFALDTLSDKSSLVMTNVPGPTEPLTIAGARILQPLFWVPQSGHLGVGLSIFSYAGLVQFGLIADGTMVHAPDRVVRYFEESFAELEALAAGSAT